MADSRDAASELMRRDAVRVRRDSAMRAPSRDGTTEGRTGMVSGERPNEFKRIAPRSPRAALEPERVPVPTRRSERVRHPLVMAGNAVFTVLILIAIAGGTLFVVAKQRFEAPGPLEQDKIVNIPPRLGIRDIADLLLREGVIDHPWTFVVSAMLAKTHDDLRFGEYQFPKQASLHDVINTIIDGKVVQHQITIPEGLTSEQIVQRLLETDILSGSIREIPREGSMLPESYRYPRGASRDQVIQRMQQAQARVVQEVWERRMPDLPLRSLQQLVVLASIVEKETGRPDERTRVAAVFVNRLKQRMKLQSDPTIIYVIEGLPQGPIANPGRAALEAVANPARTKELYFVADGTGGHAFSETLEQHQRNVARLRALEQQQRDGTPPAAAQPAAPAAGSVPALSIDRRAAPARPVPPPTQPR